MYKYIVVVARETKVAPRTFYLKVFFAKKRLWEDQRWKQKIQKHSFVGAFSVSFSFFMYLCSQVLFPLSKLLQKALAVKGHDFRRKSPPLHSQQCIQAVQLLGILKIFTEARVWLVCTSYTLIEAQNLSLPLAIVSLITSL